MMNEDISKIDSDNDSRYIKVVVNNEIQEVREVTKNYKLKENEEESNEKEYNQDQIRQLKKILKKAITDKKEIVLPLDNYLQNVEKFYLHNPFFYDNSGMFWIWDEDNYRYNIIDEIGIMNKLDGVLGFKGQTIANKIKTNYIEALKRVGRANIPKEAPIKWIQFKGKAFSIESKKIYDVTPDYFFTNPLPFELGKSTETPVIDKLFEDWVGKENKKTLYEIVAYCCLRDYPLHLIFCLVGSGRNGKSKFQGLLSKFIGMDNICSTELDTLLNSRFESFKLYKKLICSMGETNFGVLNKTSLLKKLSGQDLIGFEFKNKKPFDAYNYAKIIIASNSLPTSEDTSEGFYRRWLILDFSNTFPEGKDILKTIPEIEYNNLCRKCCKILPELLERNNFTNQGTIEERQKKYILSSNPLSLFIGNCCEKSDEYFVSYNELYNAYLQYLKVNKKRKVKKKEFKAVLDDEGFFPEKTSKLVGENEEGYSKYQTILWIDGIKLKKNWKEFCSFCSFCPKSHLTPRIEHQYENRAKRAKRAKLIDFFQENPEKEISEEDLIKIFENEALIYKDLENLSKRGEIINIKPFFWKLNQ